MRTRLRSKVTLLLIVCAALLAVGGTAMALVTDTSGNTSGTTAPSPTIQSDKADYAPGELVTLTGSGWQPGESVNIKVNDTYGATWSRNVDVTADASGNITDSFNLPNSFVSDYDVTATGAQSGTATTTFTDSNPQSLTVANTSVTVAQGSNADYGNVTVNFTGNTTACTVTLASFTQPATGSGSNAQPADSGLPANANAVFGTNPIIGASNNTPKTSTLSVSTTNSTPVGIYTFHVKGTQGAGCNGSDPVSQTLTLVVTSGNSAPTVGNISGDNTADEGQTKSYSVTATDPDSGDTLSYAWSITAGGSFAHIDGAANNSSVSLKFDDGPSSPNVTLQVVVDDGHNHAVTKTLSISVNNVAPTVTLSGPATADEGTTKHYTYTVSDPGVDTFTVSSGYPTCGTGGTVVTGSAATTATGGSFDCAFPDGPATTNVAIKVADSDGASTTASESVQIVAVANVNPTVIAPATQTANEGASATFDLGSFTDPGPDSPWAVDVDWGDGSTHGTATKTATGSLGTMSHTYADGPATKTVTVKVTDKNGGSDTKTFTVTVNNVAPNVTLDPNNDLNVTEGSTEHTYNYTISDPGDDTVQSVVTSCGANGTKVAGSDTNTNTTGSFKCTFPDGPATSTVSAKATDSDGGSDTASESVQIVAVANVAPVVTPPANQTAAEGASASFNLGSFTDPGSDSPWAVDVDWGDGSAHDTFDATSAGSLGSKSHTYADGPATKTVTVKVTDKDGASHSQSFTVDVSNVAPTVTLDPTNDLNVTEGSTEHTYNYTISDPGDDTVQSVVTSCGTNGTKVTGSDTNTDTAGSFKCTFPDGPATSTVSAKATDSDGGSDTASESVQIVAVANVAPVVTAATNQSSNEGASASFNLGSFTDPGSDSPWAVDVDWGDGSAHDTFDATSAGSLGSKSHTYADGPATKTVTVKVTDKDGESDTKTFTVDVSNVAPTVTLSGPATADEGTIKHYTYTVSDPGQDGFTVSSGYPNCGTGGTVVTGSAATTATGGSFDCAFPDGPATTNVAIKVEDSDGLSDTDSEAVQVVEVANVNPTVIAAATQTANEGASATFDLGSFSDPGPDSPWAVDVDWGDSSTHGTATKTATGSLGTMSHTYADNGTKTVTVKVTDKNGGSDFKTFTVNVANVNPTITGIAVSPLQALIGQPVSFTGTATDPSSVDTTQGFSWQWSKDGGAYAPGANPFSTSFSTCGSHSVSAKATDKDQGTSDPFSASTSVQVYSGNWLPPLQVGKDNMVQKGQVVPVKISVAGCDGLNKTGLNPEIRLAKGDPTVGINEADFTVPGIVASADTSGVMRPVSDGYIYNLRIPSDASVKANDIYAIRVSPFGIEGQYMVIAVQIRK